MVGDAAVPVEAEGTETAGWRVEVGVGEVGVGEVGVRSLGSIFILRTSSS